MKYTPGPWEIDDTYILYPIKIGGCLGGSFQIDIASILPIPGAEDEYKANIHLIAAAPELYEALQELSAILDLMADKLPPEHKKDVEERITKAKSAIARAENRL